MPATAYEIPDGSLRDRRLRRTRPSFNGLSRRLASAGGLSRSSGTDLFRARGVPGVPYGFARQRDPRRVPCRRSGRLGHLVMFVNPNIPYAPSSSVEPSWTRPNLCEAARGGSDGWTLFFAIWNAMGERIGRAEHAPTVVVLRSPSRQVLRFLQGSLSASRSPTTISPSAWKPAFGPAASSPVGAPAHPRQDVALADAACRGMAGAANPGWPAPTRA
jgi:hypothetical protein